MKRCLYPVSAVPAPFALECPVLVAGGGGGAATLSPPQLGVSLMPWGVGGLPSSNVSFPCIKLSGAGSAEGLLGSGRLGRGPPGLRPSPQHSPVGRVGSPFV